MAGGCVDDNRACLAVPRCPVGVQTVDVTATGAADLLSSAYQLTDKSSSPWIGGMRDNSNPPYYGWSWVDGTPAANLNCGTLYVRCFVWLERLLRRDSGMHNGMRGLHEYLAVGRDVCCSSAFAQSPTVPPALAPVLSARLSCGWRQRACKGRDDCLFPNSA
jgi:hypothetical protein